MQHGLITFALAGLLLIRSAGASDRAAGASAVILDAIFSRSCRKTAFTAMVPMRARARQSCVSIRAKEFSGSATESRSSFPASRKKVNSSCASRRRMRTK